MRPCLPVRSVCAQDDYNVWQRTADTWTFFTVFRTRLWLLEQKWAYVGGYSEEKRKSAARSLAKYLLGSVLALGPTFIKVGEAMEQRERCGMWRHVAARGMLRGVAGHLVDDAGWMLAWYGLRVPDSSTDVEGRLQAHMA